ncbi:putative S-adenosyl-L-methionine-dependent methyltransferase [Helianthus annuus]|uniref:Methyltransferase n=1 Tax=Helianthus annuus TaxID=4232 RepID=A0A251T723_HELAN|nr:probable methyltransferase PMT5 [Helianthus annuus]XP_021992600.1 probable methyltransferase PMT5 [Helianthus annuus]XP_021992602.1 probable methyltransferase PMT5 [Helianthus annuus]XP_021992603.1 probable methyltransferase PMT5 [Helianthus annuus]XP_021992604.1 probable methyltransferase PMT5 [Helianthus annuus]XP_021992605.1 probable methyltransferase PMT5 [Helianthus annuus]XP_021992606.1 probable methyltransferase PMT5 [Helianthus annuus]XP_035842357.1 probable methyltransferase PMT5
MRRPLFHKLNLIFGPRPPWNWLLLCFVSVLALTVLLRSSSFTTFESVSFSIKSDIYTNYRRLKEQTTSDYLELTSLSYGDSSQNEVRICGKEREHYVPCYNVSANLLAGFKDGEELDRHCELSKYHEYCLVRPPRDYKTPLSWPVGRDVIWNGNVKISKDQFLSSGSMTKRLMLLEENQISFHSDDELIHDGVKEYSHQVAEMLGLGSDVEFLQAGVRTVLDIGCGFGSFGAHLLSLKVMAVCMAAYELTGSQVQLSLERGLPAIIGNFISRKLPFPSLSYDMVHCAQCGILWDKKDGMFLIEADRILKPGGYFVLHGSSLSTKQGSMAKPIEELTQKICWTFIAQQEETFIWQKTIDPQCYSSGKQGVIAPCREGHDDIQSYYQPLASCIGGTASKRWVPIQNRSSSSQITPAELEIHEVQQDEFYEDFESARIALRNYWSLLTPLIFSDHPKRPGDEDPLPPYNMIRNVMDMNANYGGLNAAFLEAGKSVWVMNVVPLGTRNTLPLILDQGFAGVLHDWCEPFPTYPRTYDLVHANGLLSILISEGCSMKSLLLEIDRILRPEGWVVLSDTLGLIEKSRTIATQIRWEARVVDLENGSDQRLLVCQKPFVRK